MAWLLDAIEQAAQGDWQGAADTASQGLSDTADAAAGAASQAADAAAGAFGFGSGSGGGGGGGAKGGQGGGLVDEIFGALDDATGGFVSRAGGQAQRAFEAGAEAASETARQVGETVGDVVEAGTRAAQETGRQVGETVGDVVDAGTRAAQETGRQVGETASDVWEAGTKAAQETGRQVGETVGDVVDAGTRAAQETGRRVGETVGRATGAAGRAADSVTGGTATETVDHLVSAGKAALAGDLEGAFDSGQAAVQTGGRGARVAVGKVVDTASEGAGWAAETVGNTARDVVDTGLEVINAPMNLANTLTGGKLREGVSILGSAARAVTGGDLDRAAQQGAAAAKSFSEGAKNVYDAVDGASGGRLSELGEAVDTAREGLAQRDLDVVLEAGADALDTISPGRIILDIDEATGGHVVPVLEELGVDSERLGTGLSEILGARLDRYAADGQELIEGAAEVLTPGGLVESVTNKPQAWDEIRGALDNLEEAAGKALEGDFSGALDAATGAGDALDQAVADLGEVGQDLIDAATTFTPGHAAGTFSDLIDRATEQAERLAEAAADDSDAAEAAADEAASSFTEVTARLGTATAITVDGAAGGALANVLAGVEQAEAELAQGRYDDALAKLDEVAVDLGRVATVISPGRDVERLPERVAEARQTDPVRAEGHERLGVVVDAVARRLPTTSRTSSDPQEGGEVASSGPLSPSSPAVDALTDGHLPQAAAALRRAVSVDVDPDEVADAVKEATDQLRATGPVVSTSVVAVIDHDAGGHLGDTAGLATSVVRALREGDYQEAAAIAPRLVERHAEAMEDVEVEADRLADDLTEGHADAAVRHLDEATILDALGDSDAAMARAAEAADEYDAAVASYDRHLDRAVTEAAGVDAPEPVRARVVEVLDSAAGGSLTRARVSLERGAVDARSGDIASAAAAGREATGAMELAKAVYTRPDAPARLVTEVRRAVEEGEPPLDVGDFGRGALRDVVEVTPAATEEPVVDLAVEDPDRLEYEPDLDPEPVVASYEQPDLVTESALADVVADAIDPAAISPDAIEPDYDLD